MKDDGTKATYDSGMQRGSRQNKVEYHRVIDGPMLDRWANHLRRGSEKYPDPSLGKSNWTLANSPEELQRFKESALRHVIQWYRGMDDEDHAAAVFFNINGAEAVREKLSEFNIRVQPDLRILLGKL